MGVVGIRVNRTQHGRNADRQMKQMSIGMIGMLMEKTWCNNNARLAVLLSHGCK